jgi:hypothetical protein
LEVIAGDFKGNSEGLVLRILINQEALEQVIVPVLFCF